MTTIKSILLGILVIWICVAAIFIIDYISYFGDFIQLVGLGVLISIIGGLLVLIAYD